MLEPVSQLLQGSYSIFIGQTPIMSA